MKLKTFIRKPRFVWVYPLAIWFFLTAHTSGWGMIAGSCAALLGEAVRLWANGHVGHRKVNQTLASRGDAKIGQLVTSGPYAFVRHPLYFGTFLIGAGFCIIAGNAWLALAAFLLFLSVYRAKMAEEEATLLNEWGEAFRRYQQGTPRWFPTGRRYRGADERWSWQGLVSSKEWKTGLWLVVFLIAMYFRMEILQEHRFLKGEYAGRHAALLGLLAILVLIDGTEWVKKRFAMRRARLGASR